MTKAAVRCPKCNPGSNKEAEAFIEQAKAVHGGFYGYDKVTYINKKTKVLVTCPKHGPFAVTPEAHLKGRGCTMDRAEAFTAKAKAIHGDRFSYEKVKYVNLSTTITLVCPYHGEFEIKPKDHLRGCGCRKDSLR